MYEHRLNDDCKGKLEGKNFDLLNVDGKYEIASVGSRVRFSGTTKKK
jgi:hypothetical protein